MSSGVSIIGKEAVRMAKVKIPRQKNPMSNDKLWWMWIFLFPIALVAYVFCDIKEDRRIARIKNRLRKEKFNREHWEYDYWFDDQGL